MINLKFQSCFICNQALDYQPGIEVWFTFKPIELPVLCKTCQAQLVPIQRDQLHCYSCQRPLFQLSDNPYQQVYVFDNERQTLNFCFDCYRWANQYELAYLNHQSLLVYNDFLKDCLKRYKLLGDIRLAKVFKPILKPYQEKFADYTWTLIPSSPKSLKERGFHPTGEILKQAKINFVPFYEYQGDGKKQAQKSRYQRLALKQPFNFNRETLKYLANLDKLLIFDDIYTTGATLIKAKELILKKFPQISIQSLSLARDILQDK